MVLGGLPLNRMGFGFPGLLGFVPLMACRSEEQE